MTQQKINLFKEQIYQELLKEPKFMEYWSSSPIPYDFYNFLRAHRFYGPGYKIFNINTTFIAQKIFGRELYDIIFDFNYFSDRNAKDKFENGYVSLEFEFSKYCHNTKVKDECFLNDIELQLPTKMPKIPKTYKEVEEYLKLFVL